MKSPKIKRLEKEVAELTGRRIILVPSDKKSNRSPLFKGTLGTEGRRTNLACAKRSPFLQSNLPLTLEEMQIEVLLALKLDLRNHLIHKQSFRIKTTLQAQAPAKISYMKLTMK